MTQPPPTSPPTANHQPKLHVISNRIPVTVSSYNEAEKKYHVKLSSGGLVSALSGLKKEMAFTWVGWPGSEFTPQAQSDLTTQLWRDHSCLPVFLPTSISDPYYNGFANSVLWPLFHYFHSDLAFNESDWAAYQKANAMFAEAVMKVVGDGDMVWIQDYHLMLLPRLLREKLGEKGLRNVKIGFFLHTPFPSSEVYRILPVRREVLLGLLQSDLIGFHTYDYARHFLSSCTRILGLVTVPNGVEFEGRLVNVGTFPIGIDPEKFDEALENKAVQHRIADLKQKLGNRTVYVGVDRLDYIKGVPHKLHAFESFLASHPHLRSKVVFIQVGVPSRTDVEEYQQLRQNVHELVGEINGKYGTLDAMPVHFLNQSVPFDELVALYAVADVCVVSSVRDGMNLVSYEYISCQKSTHGVLILSEFAGAAQSLNGSIIINPWNTDDLAKAYHSAVVMGEDQRREKWEKLQRYVNKHTAAYWGITFVKELQRLASDFTFIQKLPRLTAESVVTRFKGSQKRRVFFFDYDGTLTIMNRSTAFAKPSAELYQNLSRLSSLPNTLVYILSGRSRTYLDTWFQDLDVGIVAEHGCFYRHKHDREWKRLADTFDMGWRDTIRPLFQHYTDRTPGSFIEEKDVNMTWHYSNADLEFGSWQAAELQVNLEKLLHHVPVSVVLGTKTLELRPSSVDKSAAVRAIFKDLNGHTEPIEGSTSSLDVARDLAHAGCDFILAIGDGRTDEAVFQFLDHIHGALTATVGKKQTHAQSYLGSVVEVHGLLASVLAMVAPK